MISETKLDESFPIGQFLIDGYTVPFRFDRNGNGGGILLYIREDIPSKLLSIYQDIEGFSVEINLCGNKKWLLRCSYNPRKVQISNHLAELGKSTDLYLTKYFFYFYLGFLSRTFTIHGTAGKGGGYLFNFSLPLPPASQTLRH